MTSIASSAAADYARAVRDALTDLPPDQMHAILDGLDEHLAEVAVDGTTDLAEALGPPSAYAAELRSAAGLPPFLPPTVPVASPAEIPEDSVVLVDLDDEPVESPEFELPAGEATTPDVVSEDVDATADRQRLVLAARIGVGLVLAVLAILVIRASEPINGLEIALGAAVVGAAWWALRWLAGRADLPEGVASRAPLVLGAAAALAAVIVGGQLAGSSREYVYVNDGPAPPMMGDGTIVLPDVQGLMVVDAIRVLGESGLGSVDFVADDGGDGGDPGPEALDRLVVWTDPAPNSLVLPGSVVVLGLGPVVPATTVLPDPITVPEATPDTVVLQTTTVEPDATPVPTATLFPDPTTTLLPDPTTTVVPEPSTTTT